MRLRLRLGGYLEFIPPPHLRRAAESIWVHTTPAYFPTGDEASHRVLPDPAVNIAFVARRDRDGRIVEGSVVLIGRKTRPHIFTFTPSREIVAVKVKLEWARSTLGLDPAEHDDRVDDLDGTMLGRTLLDALSQSASAADAATILAGSVRPPDAPGSVAAVALDLVRRSRGRVPIGRLAAHTGLSARHLHRIVCRDAGMALKPFARIHRYLNAVARADLTAAPEWARLSAETGFSDQPHLVRESRALAGIPPAALHRERRGEALRFRAG